MWKQVLDFDLRADNRSTPVKEMIDGKSFHQPLGGMVGVAGVGRDLAGLAARHGQSLCVWPAGLGPDLTPQRSPRSGRARPSAPIRKWSRQSTRC